MAVAKNSQFNKLSIFKQSLNLQTKKKKLGKNYCVVL